MQIALELILQLKQYIMAEMRHMIMTYERGWPDILDPATEIFCIQTIRANLNDESRNRQRHR